MRPDNSHRLSNQMQTYTVKNIVSGVVTPIVIVATTLRVRITNLWNAWASVGYSRSNWLIVAWDTGRVLISPTARSRACSAERAYDDAPRARTVFERVASLNI